MITLILGIGVFISVIDEELKKHIVSMWKKGVSISEVSRETGVSRPTVRKIVQEFDANRKWHIIRTERREDFLQIVVNTRRRSPAMDRSAIERLGNGVDHWEVDGLIRSIVKPETADEIMYELSRGLPPGLSVLYIKESEFLPSVKVDHQASYYILLEKDAVEK